MAEVIKGVYRMVGEGPLVVQLTVNRLDSHMLDGRRGSIPPLQTEEVDVARREQSLLAETTGLGPIGVRLASLPPGRRGI